MAAQSGVFKFMGMRSRQTYDVSAYFDDTAGNYIKFDQSAKASAASSDSWTPPEPVALIDLVLAAATAQTTTQLIKGGTHTGDFIMNALYLVTVTFRPALRVFINTGTKFQAKQIA